MYYRGFIHVLTYGRYEARKHASRVARRMVSSLGGTEIALSLVKQLRKLLTTQSVCCIRTMQTVVSSTHAQAPLASLWFDLGVRCGITVS